MHILSVYFYIRFNLFHICSFRNPYFVHMCEISYFSLKCAVEAQFKLPYINLHLTPKFNKFLKNFHPQKKKLVKRFFPKLMSCLVNRLIIFPVKVPKFSSLMRQLYSISEELFTNISPKEFSNISFETYSAYFSLYVARFYSSKKFYTSLLKA